MISNLGSSGTQSRLKDRYPPDEKGGILQTVQNSIEKIEDIRIRLEGCADADQLGADWKELERNMKGAAKDAANCFRRLQEISADPMVSEIIAYAQSHIEICDATKWVFDAHRRAPIMFCMEMEHELSKLLSSLS